VDLKLITTIRSLKKFFVNVQSSCIRELTNI